MQPTQLFFESLQRLKMGRWPVASTPIEAEAITVYGRYLEARDEATRSVLKEHFRNLRNQALIAFFRSQRRRFGEVTDDFIKLIRAGDPGTCIGLVFGCFPDLVNAPAVQIALLDYYESDLSAFDTAE